MEIIGQFRERPHPDAVSGSPADGDGLDSVVAQVWRVVSERGVLPPERKLAEELDLKRHRVRRALAILRESGKLGPARTGRPPSAMSLSGEAIVRATNPVEVIELRTMLEPTFARHAALRASPSEIDVITAATRTPTGADPAAIDLAFHRAIATASRNRLGGEIYALIRQVGRDHRIGVARPGPPCPTSIAKRDAEHGVIAAAIAARDPDQAERAMRAHLASVYRKIMDRLAP